MVNLDELLKHIPPQDLDYTQWVAVGMALKHEGYPCSVWDAWSELDFARYKVGECSAKWDSFREDAGSVVTGGTIYQLAVDHGYTPPETENRALEWDAVLYDDPEPMQIVQREWMEREEIKTPTEQWDAVGDIIKYLETLYEPEDIVGYVTEVMQDERGWRPKNAGSHTRTAEELIRKLRKYNTIEEVFGDYNHQAGGWIRFNPLDGNGVKNSNVAEYRYALVESDKTDIETQLAIIKELELPVAALVHSGKKSIHAIVRIEARSMEEYRQRVDFLYKVCKQNGLEIDTQNKNPSRLSRMPGLMRDGNKQWLIDTNMGQPTWQAWLEWVESVNDNLPDPENLEGVWDNLPPLSPCLIDGVLRKGHKMLIAGPSKAGKSFALIELCIAIAEGTSWLDFQCAQGRVMYVNLELDRASCLHRFRDVYEANDITPNNLGNIEIWNLRGNAVPMDKLAPKLIRRAKKGNFSAIILDPIYKVITGDENSADQMAKFCNQFDRVCTELDCAVIYCHHHSKGAQGGKKSMDRASGSGVFARDPDALLDFIELEIPDDKRITWDLPSAATAWRVEGTLREFATFEPINMLFEYPIHTMDESEHLATLTPHADGYVRKSPAQKQEEKQQRKEDQKQKLIDAFNYTAVDGKTTMKQMIDFMGLSERTVQRWMKKFDLFNAEWQGIGKESYIFLK